ncbi:toll/interleukin-1 receptor domain-containing protein [Reticulibacter mediterranei]|uniref:toll/interleukin-1 receptor domain-containing protein n=1 Tax=Reticulibacter mediterranei TaxID=2778369 RepID=UPI001C69230C
MTGSPDRPSVFLSYARSDQGVAMNLRAHLPHQGRDVWVERETALVFSDPWEHVLLKAPPEAHAVRALWPPSAHASHSVRAELSMPTRDQCPLSPIWMGGEDLVASVPPGYAALPPLDARTAEYSERAFVDLQESNMICLRPSRPSPGAEGETGYAGQPYRFSRATST